MKKATIVLVLISNLAKEKDQIIQIDYSEIDKKGISNWKTLATINFVSF